MTENDTDEIELIRAKKMLELQRRIAASQQKPDQKPQPEKEIDDVTLVRSNLINRGSEVLDTALNQYPKQAQEVVHQIAVLYRSGKLKEKIPGEELLALFHDLGFRVHLETTISYIKDGKRVPLSSKFKEKKPDLLE